jgi:lysine-ketoglutarate reductase/saccharopine dehydrogenase-like protein (TIGR00300 family)
MKRRFVSDGHLIDSGILAAVLNLIVEENADYEIIDFTVGKTNANPSHLEIDLICSSEEQMAACTEKLVQTGCYEKRAPRAVVQTAGKDGTVPENFYSTTNHRTEVFWNEKWIPVENQRMDGVIVIENGTAVCKKLRDVRQGDAVICSSESVRVFPPERERSQDAFGFMSNEVSSERGIGVLVNAVAEEMKRVRSGGGKIVAVAGPVIIHTNGSRAFAALCKSGYIKGVLTGNALAVHDIEYELFGTSLGIDLATGRPTNEGHRNHMRAINMVRRFGSIQEIIKQGHLRRGIMYELETGNVPYCLAGSIRDDGPLPETENNMIRAQERYAEIVAGADMVLMLSTMLHSIGTGNMLPSWVKTVCVDINPAVVTKLIDRGSAQTIGIVSDIGLFVRVLTEKCIGREEV